MPKNALGLLKRTHVSLGNITGKCVETRKPQTSNMNCDARGRGTLVAKYGAGLHLCSGWLFESLLPSLNEMSVNTHSQTSDGN